MAIKETLSALRFRPSSEIKIRTRKQTIGIQTPRKEKSTSNRIVTPVVTPPEIEGLLKKHPEAQNHYVSLAPSHKRSYIEWILSAKREETKVNRLDRMIGMLLKGQKGPYAK